MVELEKKVLVETERLVRRGEGVFSHKSLSGNVVLN